MVICSVRPCRVKQRVRKFAHPCGYKREYRFSRLVSWPTVKEKAQRLCKCATLVKAGDLAYMASGDEKRLRRFAHPCGRRLCRTGCRSGDKNDGRGAQICTPLGHINRTLIFACRPPLKRRKRTERGRKFAPPCRTGSAGFLAVSSSLSDWGLISMCQQFCCGLSG
jgi:hypothetical protein